MSPTVAVIAHKKKTLGAGLDRLRVLISEQDVGELLWYEVPKSKKAPKRVAKALKKGADLVFVWGGDGMVQRCSDVMAGSGVPMAILPAGTANLFARDLGIPIDLEEAVRLGFQGRRRKLDLGKLNGEHFAVMAGAGFEAEMIADADGGSKGRLGRLAYVSAAVRHVGGPLVPMTVKVDGVTWFEGKGSCLLLGNIGTITGGIRAFDDARPDDGWLEVGVSTAQGPIQWARVLGRMTAGRSDESPFVRITRAREVTAEFGAPLMYELDGGDREPVDRLEARVVPGALTVCVPEAAR
ncbi:diacylglycerol kinase [Sphaerisporangium siamense]|uniref:Diacylglycerol kinase family enzyme n=1 Tax=Sphaerisporangium siamense TaxID=795645 RepID=A0A7W7GAT9_9ACTN|nr:diacylglycerol kinase family protein [Sphaerisporangium siamense]MBB4702115.1 diacylglycerol kinase family enzyme [Sphaerisporangium siamense]GII87192.1 diacylglycerol kinase [Sphaerisporangium siamense]